MTNLQRLQLEIQGIDLTTDELSIYLQENNLEAHNEYIPTSNTNKRAILKTALSILESIANNPALMKEYKTEDMTVSNFHENLESRIDQLERKIRQIPNDNQLYEDGASFFYLFTE